MSAENPPLYLQNGTHPAVNDRRFAEQTLQRVGGVLYHTDLAVTERSGTPNMSVDVASGAVLVPGSEASGQGSYFCYSSATVNLAIGASDATNDRYDLVVATVADSAYSGGSDEWSLDVVAGTAAASPVFPSAPANSIVLATVHVQALASSIVDADITDVRFATDTQGSTVGNAGSVAAIGGRQLVSGTGNVSSPVRGQGVRLVADNSRYGYSGSAWVKESAHWEDYKSSLTFSGGVTAWGGTARISRRDKMCTVALNLDATTIGTSFIEILGLPAAHSSYSAELHAGILTAYDVSANVGYAGLVRFDSATQISVRDLSAPGTAMTHAYPFTWAVGDQIIGTFTYELA